MGGKYLGYGWEVCGIYVGSTVCGIWVESMWDMGGKYVGYGWEISELWLGKMENVDEKYGNYG